MTFGRFCAGLIGIPLAILIVLFAVANRESVTLSLDPFNAEAPALAFSAPLFGVMLVSLMAGVLIGGVASWSKQGRWRKECRQRRVEATRLEAETEAARREAAAARSRAAAALPAPSRAA